MKTRRCPFDGCGVMVEPDLFACGRHWRSLSPSLKARVWGAYREWQRGAIDGDELRRRQQEVLDAAQGVAGS